MPAVYCALVPDTGISTRPPRKGSDAFRHASPKPVGFLPTRRSATPKFRIHSDNDAPKQPFSEAFATEDALRNHRKQYMIPTVNSAPNTTPEVPPCPQPDDLYRAPESRCYYMCLNCFCWLNYPSSRCLHTAVRMSKVVGYTQR
jgi:hypothetical protein